MEDALGHVTHAQALRAALGADERYAPVWMPVPYRADDGLERLPGLPFSLKISLRARALLRLRMRAATPLQGLFFHTQGLTPCCLPMIARTPSVISLDATPRNFDAIAAAYGERPATGVVGAAKTAWFRRVFARARGIVTFSHWVRDSLLADYGLPAQRVAVLPQGVDTQLWQPSVRDRPAGSPLRLLFVGADFRRKGGELLLQAWRAGLSAWCELDIVTRDAVAAEGARLRVHRGLTPNSPALKQLYAQADVFVLPSLGDASPFAVLEALASGLPVVAAAVGAVHEMVEHGVSGWLVPPGDAQAVVAPLRALAGDAAALAAMRRAARAAAEQRFHGPTNYRRLLDHVHATLEPRRP